MGKNVGVAVKCAVFKRFAHGMKGERDGESQRSNIEYSRINVDNRKSSPGFLWTQQGKRSARTILFHMGLFSSLFILYSEML